MNEGINKKYIIIGIIVVLCIMFSKNIRYFFVGKNDVMVDRPTAVYFSNPGEPYGEVYQIEGTHKKVYVTVDKKYLNNDDTEIYVSGKYWNSPETPLIKVNGKVIDKVTKENSGKTDWVLGDTYYSKMYHFYMNETIVEGKEYKFYVRIKDTSETVTVIFTSKEVDEWDWE